MLKKQKILFKTHITFIGIGGINCPALIYLLAIGIRNITLIDYDKVDRVRGMDITITTSAKTDDEGRALLEAFNFPFKK